MVKRPAISLTKCSKIGCKDSPAVTDYQTGEVICSNCGRVLQESVVLHAKARAFTKEGYHGKRRTGMPSSLRLADKGLSTVMSSHKDSSGKKLSSAAKQKYGRLKIWDTRIKSKSSSQRNLVKALIKIDSLREKLSLSDTVIEEAAYIFRKSHSLQLSKGRGIQLLAAASIYAACRSNGVPRNLTVIAQKANVNRKSLSRMYRDLADSLELKYEPFEPEKFVSKLSSMLNISEKVKRYALKILSKAKEKRMLVGKRPMGLAAAALYLACAKTSNSISQKQISEASKISTPTIRTCYKELHKLDL